MLKLPDLSIDEANGIVHAATPADILDYYDTPFSISKMQSSEYQENGYIKLECVLETTALKHTRKVIGAAVLLRKEKDRRIHAEKSQYEQSFLQCGYLCWDYPAVKDFVFARRFAGIARDLMGVEGIRLWHDQALFKESGGRITDMHQDTSYWPVATRNTTTMWLALVDVPVERGCLYFLPGTHDSVEGEYVDIFNNPHIPEQVKKVERKNIPLREGDATFHNGLTFHGANPNKTSDIRQAMTVIYIADGIRFDASDERNRTHTSCEGLSDGDLIDTKYTPRLV
jgi:ectoine hydroxylase-related dioxygenase (phytanoyl-CoA dioxygenase family)